MELTPEDIQAIHAYYDRLSRREFTSSTHYKYLTIIELYRQNKIVFDPKTIKEAKDLSRFYYMLYDALFAVRFTVTPSCIDRANECFKKAEEIDIVVKKLYETTPYIV